jgi:hypothetical protein
MFDPTNKLPSVGRKFPAGVGSVSTTEHSSPSLSHLFGHQLYQVSAITEEFSDILTTTVGLTRLLKYDIQFSDRTPVNLPPNRLMPPKMPILRQDVQKVLDQGGGKPFNSEHSSRIFLVPKREGEFRPIVNYCALNQKIRVETVPLPDILS